jgi:hypothetical protein
MSEKIIKSDMTNEEYNEMCEEARRIDYTIRLVKNRMKYIEQLAASFRADRTERRNTVR